jgi:hypothetical protein
MGVNNVVDMEEVMVVMAIMEIMVVTAIIQIMGIMVGIVMAVKNVQVTVVTEGMVNTVV